MFGILCITMSISTLGYSPFTKGKILAGGRFSVDFNTNKYQDGGTTTKGVNTNSISFYPQIGYFFMDNFAAGAGLNVSLILHQFFDFPVIPEPIIRQLNTTIDKFHELLSVLLMPEVIRNCRLVQVGIVTIAQDEILANKRQNSLVKSCTYIK